MEKNYQINNYDYQHFYYFVSDQGNFEVAKSISKAYYKELNRNYYQKTKSWLFSYLFEGEDLPKKIPTLKFLILDLEQTDSYNKQKIIELIQDLIGNMDVLELKEKTVCFYYEHLELNFKDIIDTINNDFYTKIKLYESGKLNKPQDFKKIFEIYLQYNINSSRFYTNNGILIIDLANKDLKLLKKLKPLILHKFLHDSQFETLINSLFSNNLNVTKTAQDVFMHRNTINNKIETIEKETGLNIQNFYDALALYLLINFH